MLEADDLLATLQGQTEFSVSEVAKIEEIQGLADDERHIAARAKVDWQNIYPAQSTEYYAEKCRADGVDSVVHEIVRKYADMGKVGANECIRVAKVLRDAGVKPE